MRYFLLILLELIMAHFTGVLGVFIGIGIGFMTRENH